MSDDAALLLVEENTDPTHPAVIRNQLAQQVRKLLREHVAKELISEGLREWDLRPDAGPPMLPHLVSVAIRRRRAQQQQDTRRASMTDWEEQLRKEMTG